jgi:hypothetical protein
MKTHYNEKFGSNEITAEDKAGERYRLPLNVEYPDPSEHLATIKDSVELREGKAVLSGTSTKHNVKWIPGTPMTPR